MRQIGCMWTALVVVGVLATAPAAHAGSFQITPAIQSIIDQQRKVAEQVAAEPVVVAAVVAQNGQGPLAGMDNAKWKETRRSDAIVKQFQENAAAQVLRAKADQSKGVIGEAFLNAALGEKVAFVDKTSSYIHKGQPKFEVPFGGAPFWQGEPSFDESSQAYLVQISVPVKNGGKTIGVLVVGLNLGS